MTQHILIFWVEHTGIEIYMLRPKFWKEILHCDLECRSRSLVFELDLGLAWTHLGYQFRDCRRSVKRVIV